MEERREMKFYPNINGGWHLSLPTLSLSSGVWDSSLVRASVPAASNYNGVGRGGSRTSENAGMRNLAECALKHCPRPSPTPFRIGYPPATPVPGKAQVLAAFDDLNAICFSRVATSTNCCGTGGMSLNRRPSHTAATHSTDKCKGG